MALIQVTPPAGIVTNGTEYANKGRWINGNLVRFENGYLRPIGGWEKLRTTPLDGTPTNMFAYITNNGTKVLAVGTREKVYVMVTDTWYDITPSGFVNDASTDPLGYGAYHYDVEDYGDARSQSGLSFDTNNFSFDNFGEILIFCSSSDGKIYQWNPGSPSTIASVVSNAPTDCTGVFVTNERHVVAYGAGGDPRKIQWSSRETLTTWTPASTNTAGDLQIPTGGTIIHAIKWQTDIVLYTDTGVARMYYTGSPFIYGIQDAGTNCKTISARTVVSSGAFLTWMGENSFFIFDGSVKEIKCDVHDYIFDDLNTTYRKTSCGGHNSNYNEMWFFFPSASTQTPDKYVIWNYLDNVWSIGALDRGCWLDQGVFDFPVACDSSGEVYQHDSTTLNNSINLGSSVPFCESGPIEIGNGDNYVQCNQIIPDEEAATLPGVSLSFTGRFTPLGAETDFGTFTFNSDGYTDARFTARQVKMKITGDTDQTFQVGKIRLNVRNRGRR
tara:strand:- start:204 stop:1700 length:1497 start_codon:yes stop_codon:yes gene_type:complete